ncbi:MAG: hypothetical protein ABSD48_10885 [Armatimonadota bacterium]|jgi:hypothetical protein
MAGESLEPTAVPKPVPAPGRHGALHALGFSLAAVTTALVLRLSNPTVPDPDTFYHFRHAALYAQKSLLMSAFPWLAYSIVNRFASDIGYGFHVLLLPFTLFSDPVLGLKLAAVFETVVVMILFYHVMRRHAIPYAFIWPFMLIFFSAPIVFTVLQTRPQTLTMGLSALLVSFLLTGGPWGVFLSSFLISFVHLNVIVIVPIMVGVVGVVKGLSERRWEWRLWLMALAGVVAGWLLRPNPLGAGRIEYVQLLVHEAVRQQNIPLLFGREWEPVSASALGSFTYFILIWMVLLAVLIVATALRRHYLAAGDRTFLWSSLALAGVFFIATVAITKRTTPLWATFSVMFVAKAFACFLDPADRREKQLLKEDARLVIAFAIAAIFAAMVWDGINQHVVQKRWLSIDPYRMKASAEWLKSHGRSGDIVFNVNWDVFPELFFWDTDQRYASGLDPMFLFAYDRGLYWKAHHLQAGEATDHTWGSMMPAAGRQDDTYAVLRRGFKASYVVLSKGRNAALYRYMLSDTRFAVGFEDADTAVFAVR